MARRMLDGRKVVATAGTAEPLSAISAAVSCLVLQAMAANTSAIAVGASTVVAASGATMRGIIMSPGDVMTMNIGDGIDDLASMFVDARVSGEGLTWVAMVA